MTPLIGITAITRERVSPITDAPHATLNEQYARLCEAAGGAPVVLVPVDDPAAVMDGLDALVLSGGGDVEPSVYGGPSEDGTEMVDPRRDAFELGLLDAARARGRPILGVCRGMQVLNVGFGGTLIGELARSTKSSHYEPKRWDSTVHSVRMDPASKMSKALGASDIEVNSLHHQAIENLGRGLRAVGWADDGVIEAVEGESEPVFGVQWHPEWMTGADFEAQVRVFQLLTDGD